MAFYAVACSGYFNSVHFLSTPDFGVPPPPFMIGSWGEDKGRPVPFASEYPEPSDPGCSERTELRAKVIQRLLKDGSAAEGKQDWDKALSLWDKAKIPAPGCGYTPAEKTDYDKVDIEEFRADRIEVLGELAKSGGVDGAKDYLEVTAKLGDLAGLTAISGNPSSRFLRAHALYALGIAAYDKRDLTAAQGLFQQAATLGGPRRERSVVMAIRSLLASGSWQDGVPEESNPANLLVAKQLLQDFKKEFPDSRYKRNMVGWEARAAYLSGDRVGAVQTYLDLYRTQTGQEDAVSQLSSIRRITRELTPADATALRAALISKPGLLAPYLEFRVYHSKATVAELGQLVDFISEVTKNQGAVALGGDISARLGEIAYLQGKHDEALKYAEAALGDAKSERRDLATYVKAGVLNKQRKANEAFVTLSDFETKFPKSYLIRPMLEFRASLAEKLGKWPVALATYRTLNYRYDFAYLVDVRLPVAQLLQVAKDPLLVKDAEVLRLAAGYRRLRVNDFAGARAAFKSVPDAARYALLKVGSKEYQGFSKPDPKGFIDRIPNPLTTVSDLERLTADRTPKGKYALASYYYSHRNLMLYNASLWDGMRNNVLHPIDWSKVPASEGPQTWQIKPSASSADMQGLASEGGVFSGWNSYIATKADRDAINAHFHQHECLWRAREICIALAKSSPKSDVTPLALYRAATATRRLARFNSWWDKESLEATGNKTFYVEAANLLKQLYTQFPKHALAKNARKYEKVYRQEKKDNAYATMFGR